MNTFTRTFLQAFVNTLFTQFVAGLKAQPDYDAKKAYPVKIYFDNKEQYIQLQAGDKPAEKFTKKTEQGDNGEKEFNKFINTLADLCRQADNSHWMSVQITNENQYFCKFSCGYSLKNYEKKT